MSAPGRLLLSSPLLLLLACTERGATTPDLATRAPPWQKGLAATADLYPTRRGLRDVRGIIHLHSVYSHDACDGHPLVGGKPAQPCHENLRQALCATHQDYVMLTDHDGSMADQKWDDLFLPRPGDESVMGGGKHVASWLACPDGARILLQVGGENDVMPIGLEDHVAVEVEQRHALMNGTDAKSIAAFRSHGGLVAFAHTESKSLELLRAAKADAVEIYNLHANLDPKIRALMGMDPTAPLVRLRPFLQPQGDSPEPDLAFLALSEDLPAELSKFQTLLAEGARVTATAGSDAHENTLQEPMLDGERGDSYRRVLRWFSNHLLLKELSAGAVKEALLKGRAYVLFELLGPARGFDARLEAKGGVVEVGGEAKLSDAPTIVVDPPRDEVAPGQLAPTLRVRIILADRAEGTEVASGDGTQPLRFAPTKPGAYRVEVRILPRHLQAYMGTAAAQLLREVPWIYTNPFYVR